MLVYFALGDANFLRPPCTFLFFFRFLRVGYPTQTPFPVEYRLRWVPGVGSLRWACTFHALGDANCTRRKPVFLWNMGFIICKIAQNIAEILDSFFKSWKILHTGCKSVGSKG